ncbi:hypothetical protein ACP2W0_08745 [Pseudobacillus badius]|uniref:hypothetical protein n=1 Tax=Bacillus badius TaxID=1455 RepID=UPI000A8F726D|nr:hypothetical protein [Bacillus badius]MED0665839.1 hypothetical protein [Bacillus badius]TDW03338.1 hypothetical protein B0G66_104249 [Bacillus badius]UAT32155.1 hypothetical protein K7T73_08070 [Bacillus badius]GLY11111.1 hypothetical protein Bbad01_23270 [Bacillus badius]
MKEQDIILYEEKKYRIIRIDEAGYCDIMRLSPPHQVELTHIKHLRNCPIISPS